MSSHPVKLEQIPTAALLAQIAQEANPTPMALAAELTTTAMALAGRPMMTAMDLAALAV
jgi:hypothetical protein